MAILLACGPGEVVVKSWDRLYLGRILKESRVRPRFKIKPGCGFGIRFVEHVLKL